jgi:uncharacterized protein (DUF1697 family)
MDVFSGGLGCGLDERINTMKRYIALLRGINVGGKNKLAMSELKARFEKLGFTDVSTHLNSGNVIFSTDIDDTEHLAHKIKIMIEKNFELDQNIRF